MKTHETLTITSAWLGDAFACEDGRDSVATLLPIEVSTDPIDNLVLADTLIARGAQYYCDWLHDRCYGSPTNLERPDSDYQPNGRTAFRDYFTDPYVVAQWLAHAADHYLGRKGR